MTATRQPGSLTQLDSSALADLVSDASALARKDSTAAALALVEVHREALRRGDQPLAAQCAYLEARCALDQGELAAALDLIDEARTTWLEAGDALSAARTDLGRMNVLDDLGRHTEAIEVGQALVATLCAMSVEDEEEDQVTWLRAGALENLGVSRGYLGLHQEALDAHTQAEQLYRQLGCEDEMVQPLANRGVELLELGDASAAIAALREAAVAFDRQGDQLFLAKCLVYEARAQLLLGDYLACMAATERAEAIVLGQEGTTEFARIQLVRADTLTSLNLLDSAQALYDRLAALFAAENMEHDRAAAEAGRAIVLARLGRIDDAKDAFGLAVELFAAVGDESRAAFTRVGLSDLLEPDAASSLVASTIPTLRTDAHPAQLATALLRLAELDPDDGRSFELLDEVAELLERHELPHLVWKHLHERGRRLEAVGRQHEARTTYAHARDAIDSLRTTVSRDFERLPFMVGRDAVHKDSLALLLAMGKVDEAYEIADTARSRTLVEAMSGRITPSSVVASSSELDRLYNELLRAPATQAARLWDDVHSLEGETRPASAEAHVNPGSEHVEFGVVITYQLLDDEVLAFVSENGAVRVVRGLTTVDELRLLQTRLEAQWRRFDDPNLAARRHATLLSTVVDILQQLHIRLIAPLEVLDADALLIVPQGPLANVPFSALHDGTCHLVERMPVTMAPSSSAAAHARARARTRPAKRRLVIGIASDETPGVLDEVSAISAHRGATTLIGQEATVDAFFEAVADCDIIHIASHGISRSDNPVFSAVQFADRWLTAGEIAGMALSGQLVVLSSCSSGRQHGVNESAELNGLPRALLAAGAGAVVVNLWRADDAVAASMMERFHDHLEHHDPARALRLAQQETMMENPHPYRWGPTVVIGSTSTNKEPT